MAAIGTLPVVLGVGVHGSRPAAGDVGKGGLYSCTTHSLIYQTDGSTWATWATFAAASGAPTTSQYLVGALDGGLSAEKVRADLYKNYDPDNYPTSGTGSVVDEFDTGSLSGSWSWDSAPTATVSASRFPGFLHFDGGTNATPDVRYLRQAYVPGASTAFSAAFKVSLAHEDGNFAAYLGLAVLTSADALIATVRLQNASDTSKADAYRLFYGVTPTLWKEVTVPLAFAPEYYLMTRSTADVYNFYASNDGLIWQWLGTITSATTVSKIAIAYTADTDATHIEAKIDFVRTFTSVTRIIGA